MTTTPTTAELTKTVTSGSDKFTIGLDGDVVSLKKDSNSFKGYDEVTFTKSQYGITESTEEEAYNQNFGLVGSLSAMGNNKCYYDTDQKKIYIGVATAPSSAILGFFTAGSTAKLVQSDRPTKFVSGEVVSTTTATQNAGQNNEYTLFTITTETLTPNGNNNANYLESNSNARLHYFTVVSGLAPALKKIISEDTAVDNLLGVS